VNAHSATIKTNGLDTTNTGVITIDGGAGMDIVIGGEGADTFVLNGLAEPGYMFADFTSGEDSLLLGATFGFETGMAVEGKNFSVITETYNGINAGVNATYLNGDPSLVYSDADSALYHDANGKDEGGYTVIASFNSGTKLVDDDIHFAA
jgi:hypothetical protein